MSNIQQSFNAGQSKGHTQEKTEEWIQSTKDSANAAADKATGAAQSTVDSAQHGQQQQQQNPGLLQQTGEQVKNMAQGAVESVKNTLGVGERKSN